ncbi:MAG: J domain-containing protein [Anaerolineae bacterium]|nr:J domain-containing protein [Anaerolineae bacterium]
MSRQEPTHYDTLGVRPLADLEAIKRAYREQIRRYHPDNLAAERARLQKNGDKAALRALDARIEDYQRRTQAINAAYAVLSDEAQRAAYDRKLRLEDVPPTPSANYTPPANRAAPSFHSRPANSRASVGTPDARKQDSVPYALFAAFGFVLVFVMSFLASFLNTSGNAPVAVGKTANDLQATQNAQQATAIARTATAAAPTPTRLSAESQAAAADAFFAQGAYAYAVEGYTKALQLAPNQIDLYRKRGLAYFRLALQTNERTAVAAARRDLRVFLARGGEADEVVARALESLGD